MNYHKNQLMTKRKLPLFSFWQVALLCALCFDEWVITILETTVSKNLTQLLMFDEWVITILDPKSYTTSDV